MSTATLPSGARGRALALGLTLLALAVLWEAAAAPLLDWFAARADRLAQQQALAAKMATLVAGIPALQQQLEAASRAPRQSLMLTGATDAIAAARLQQAVQDMAAQAGVTLATAEALPAAPAGGYRRVGVHVAVSGSWTVLVSLFAAIQQARPLMLLDDLQIGTAAAVPAENDKLLQASFTVLALHPAQDAAAQGAAE